MTIATRLRSKSAAVRVAAKRSAVLHEALAGSERRNKYNARKVELDGHTFDSAKEANRYVFLKHRQRIGEITGLTIQPEFNLVVNGLKVSSYKADFGYFENGQAVIDDTKGFKARDWPLRSKLFMALFPHIELRVNGIKAKAPKPPKSNLDPAFSLKQEAA